MAVPKTDKRTASQSAADTAGAPDAVTLQAAARVLRAERDGVEALITALDGPLGQSLSAAVVAIERTTGRLIVTGMGKSGHVARKIAATLASVGTPAYFVHPAEASHGDLGMITADDAVFALSNSGETQELSDITAFCRRHDIPLIGMTSRTSSTLAEMASVALVLPAQPEACPLGLAPTTSTTMMLALGDALAVALIERRGFTADEFHQFHPGGKLGRKLLRVSDIMAKGDELPLAGNDAGMDEIILTISEKRLGCCGIVDADGRLVGIITDGDLRRHFGPALLGRKASEIMTEEPRTIRAEALAAEALGIMNRHQITGLFVTDGRRPTGFIHMHDCLREGVA